MRDCIECGKAFNTNDRHRKCCRCRKLVDCPNCDGRKTRGAKVCDTCTQRSGEANGNWRGGKTYHRKGYVAVRIDGKYKFQHVIIMEEALGRPLEAGENVHHKNGNRSDNRPENLELWVTAQPSGQRPEDLVAYAKEILERYSPESLA